MMQTVTKTSWLAGLFATGLFATGLFATGLAAAVPERIPITRDNSIILVEGEQHLNHGTRPNIRIKGNQHIVAMGIDPTPLQGKRILRATLCCRQGEATIDGLTISTIQAPWQETSSNALKSGVGEKQGWAWPGARFPAVCGGNSASLICQAPSKIVDGWYHWEVAPDLLHAIATGMAYGLALHEWSADYRRNPTIHAREDKKTPPTCWSSSARVIPSPCPRLAWSSATPVPGVGCGWR